MQAKRIASSQQRKPAQLLHIFMHEAHAPSNRLAQSAFKYFQLSAYLNSIFVIFVPGGICSFRPCIHPSLSKLILFASLYRKIRQNASILRERNDKHKRESHARNNALINATSYALQPLAPCTKLAKNFLKPSTSSPSACLTNSITPASPAPKFLSSVCSCSR